jgi:hypothetical protein
MSFDRWRIRYIKLKLTNLKMDIRMKRTILMDCLLKAMNSISWRVKNKILSFVLSRYAYHESCEVSFDETMSGKIRHRKL